MSIYKLNATGSGGTEESLASLDVQFNGVIQAIAGTMESDADADADRSAVEVSFLSSATFGVNDARGSIFMMRNQWALTTSGVYVTGLTQSVSGMEIPVNRGERIHMHLFATTAVVTRADVYLYVRDASDPRLTRRR